MPRPLTRLLPFLTLLAVLCSTFAIAPRPAFAAGQPQSSLTLPAEVRIGEPFSFSVAFDNTSAVDTGYGPFIDLIIPSRGADGTGTPDDGITFLNADYLGAPVTAIALVFPAGGCVTHPYARLQSGVYQQVCGTPGDTLVVLQLPFGSFTPSQPPVEIAVNARLSPNADLGTPLTIRHRAGFQFGNTPLNDWCCDPVILSQNPPPAASAPSGGWPGSPLTPVLYSLNKTYLGPEDETATGPNFLRSYALTVDVADGQTLTNLVITDLLPPTMAFRRVVSVTPASGVVLDTPTVDTAAATPNNDLIVRFPSLTGGPGAADAVVVFEFFVPRLDAAAAAIISPTTGDDVLSPNNASASADWDPSDTRDPVTSVPAVGVGPGPEHLLTAKSLAIQKSVAVSTDTGAVGPTPGDTLAYTIDLQISDFFAFNNLIVADVFSDGQRLDPTFAPTLSVQGNGFTLAAAAFASANYTLTVNADNNPATPASDGSSSLTFRLSAELLSRGRPDGRLIGGCINPVTGSPSLAALPSTMTPPLPGSSFAL